MKLASYRVILELRFRDPRVHEARLVPWDYRAHQVPRGLRVPKDVQALRAQKVSLALLVSEDIPVLKVPGDSKVPKDSMDRKALKGTREHPAQKVPRALLV